MKKTVCLLMAVVCLLAFMPASFAEDNIPLENRDPDKYYLELNLTNQVVTAFEKDEQGEYTQIVRQMICSTGVDEFPTPAGTFKMGSMKERFGYFVYYKVWAQYWS
ncbi:MAG: L,D-transpeptidase, partial [Christensenellales bacterium]